MTLTVWDYLILNSVVALFLVFYFLFWRRSKPYKGFRLKSTKTKKIEDPKSVQDDEVKHEVGGEDSFFGIYDDLVHDEEVKQHEGEKLEIKSQPGSLNVIFMYNGHEWDAHEVLSIPAGSSEETVRKAYHKVISKVDKESRDFFHMAYRALLEGRRISYKSKS